MKKKILDGLKMIAERIQLLFVLLIITGFPLLKSQIPAGNPQFLVSTTWLEDHLQDTSLVILHYGDEENYKKAHIPGARLISMKPLVIENELGIKHEFPDKMRIQKVLRSWGIYNHSRIIICHGEKDGLIMASRLFATLDLAGLEGQTSILNGGFQAWKNEKRVISNEIPQFSGGSVSVSYHQEKLALKQWLFTQLNNDEISIVDARPEKLYKGESEDHNTSRLGHITGAINITYDQVLQKKSPNFFKSAKELTTLFETKGIDPESIVVTYCGSGIWTSTIYFAARLQGYRVLFYDGSFQEWGDDPTMPVSK